MSDEYNHQFEKEKKIAVERFIKDKFSQAMQEEVAGPISVIKKVGNDLKVGRWATENKIRYIRPLSSSPKIQEELRNFWIAFKFAEYFNANCISFSCFSQIKMPKIPQSLKKLKLNFLPSRQDFFAMLIDEAEDGNFHPNSDKLKLAQLIQFLIGNSDGLRKNFGIDKKGNISIFDNGELFSTLLNPSAKADYGLGVVPPERIEEMQVRGLLENLDMQSLEHMFGAFLSQAEKHMIIFKRNWILIYWKLQKKV